MVERPVEERPLAELRREEPRLEEPRLAELQPEEQRLEEQRLAELQREELLLEERPLEELRLAELQLEEQRLAERPLVERPLVEPPADPCSTQGSQGTTSAPVGVRARFEASMAGRPGGAIPGAFPISTVARTPTIVVVSMMSVSAVTVAEVLETLSWVASASTVLRPRASERHAETQTIVNSWGPSSSAHPRRLPASAAS